MLDDSDVAKALIQYITESAVEVLVLGAGSKGGFLRYGYYSMHCKINRFFLPIKIAFHFNFNFLISRDLINIYFMPLNPLIRENNMLGC